MDAVRIVVFYHRYILLYLIHLSRFLIRFFKANFKQDKPEEQLFSLKFRIFIAS